MQKCGQVHLQTEYQRNVSLILKLKAKNPFYSLGNVAPHWIFHPSFISGRSEVRVESYSKVLLELNTCQIRLFGSEKSWIEEEINKVKNFHLPWKMVSAIFITYGGGWLKDEFGAERVSERESGDSPPLLQLLSSSCLPRSPRSLACLLP